MKILSDGTGKYTAIEGDRIVLDLYIPLLQESYEEYDALLRILRLAYDQTFVHYLDLANQNRLARIARNEE